MGPTESLQTKTKLDISNYDYYNSDCEFPEGSLDSPHFLGYHLHAKIEDNSDFCGPSLGYHPARQADNGDLSVTLKDIKEWGESHAVVITKLHGKNFNLMYYGGKEKNGEFFGDIINLGDWNYK